MWQANSAQLALFCTTVDGLDAEKLFKLSFNQDPETSQKSRTISALNPFLSVAAGVFEGLQYVVQIQAGRLDVLVSSTPSAEINLDAEIKTFDCEVVLGRLVDVVSAVAAENLPVVRVALVAQLLQPVATYVEAARIVGGMLGSDLERDDMSDLLFQINRRKSLEPGYEMNRLVRLGVLAADTIVTQMVQGGGHMQVQKLAASMMLDFNSVPLPDIIVPATQLLVAQQLRDEIMVVGSAANPIRSVLDEG